MSIYEIIGGAVLLLASVIIIIANLLQETKQPGLSSAIGGGSNESFYGKNSGRSREAKLVRFTGAMTVIFFIVTLALNLLPIILGDVVL
ncbi:MAG: preprotein translocase subunit SecG [Ruminococcus sp.]|nr:preprotein translocase subunit SecG [Ruminococcus sp.]